MVKILSFVGLLFLLPPLWAAEDPWFACKNTFDTCVSDSKETRNQGDEDCKTKFGVGGENDFEKLVECKRPVSAGYSKDQKKCDTDYKTCTYDLAKKGTEKKDESN